VKALKEAVENITGKNTEKTDHSRKRPTESESLRNAAQKRNEPHSGVRPREGPDPIGA
jgi:hypothetical protein